MLQSSSSSTSNMRILRGPNHTAVSHTNHLTAHHSVTNDGVSMATIGQSSLFRSLQTVASCLNDAKDYEIPGRPCLNHDQLVPNSTTSGMILSCFLFCFALFLLSFFSSP